MDTSEDLREKTAAEVALIEQVQRAAEAATEAVIVYLKQAEVAYAEEAHAIIDVVLEDFGCESPEGHIVAGGRASAEPHETGVGILQKQQPIVIDIFPRSKETGYFADMSRTVCLGEPSKELQMMYTTVLKAQELAISMVAPGVRCATIHQAVEAFFMNAGYTTTGQGKEFRYAEGFVHALGHGVGKRIHEAPRISRESDDVLAIGDVITIEPGLYYHALGGVRIEDLLLVTPDGARNLTQFPKIFVI